MNSKRDYIEEILDKKTRLLKRSTIRLQFEQRLHPLVQGFRVLQASSLDKPVKAELLKYIPIGYVACIEGYCRLAVKTLIDKGEPYLDRVAKLDELQFKPKTVAAIVANKISLGDYVSHLIPLNNLQDINRVFSVLADEDALTAIKRIDSLPGDDGRQLQFPTPLFADSDVARVQELFRIRHILAHELATKEKFGVRRIQACISAAAGFSLALYGYVDELLNKH